MTDDTVKRHKILAPLLLCGLLLTGCGDELFEYVIFAPARPLPADADYCNYRDRNRAVCEAVDTQEIFFPSLDKDVELHALYLRSPSSDKIILYLHGNGGHIYWRYSQMGQVTEFANVFMLGYRGYGKSTGEPSEQGIYKDVRAALRYIKDELQYPASKIYIYGHSLGAALVAEVGQDESFGGLIFVSPFLSGHAVAEQRGLAWLLEPHRPFHSVEKVQRITDTPALFIHGTADTVIPFEQGLALYEHYAGDKLFVRVEGFGHFMFGRRLGNRYWQWIRQFIEGSTEAFGEPS